MAKATAYTFRSRKFDDERTTPLLLVWEANYSSYPHDEGMKGADAWRAWRKKESGDSVSIYWSVQGENLFETAPFCGVAGADFLTYFTWPVDPNGEPVNWASLPVKDGKSDWIAEYTGWRPAPFTPEIPAALIEQAMGLR